TRAGQADRNRRGCRHDREVDARDCGSCPHGGRAGGGVRIDPESQRPRKSVRCRPVRVFVRDDARDLRRNDLPVVRQRHSALRAGKPLRAMKVELITTRDNIAELRIDGRTVFVPYIVQGTQVSFKYDGETYSIDNSEKSSRSKPRHRDQSMSAPMPGVVLKVL